MILLGIDVLLTIIIVVNLFRLRAKNRKLNEFLFKKERDIINKEVSIGTQISSINASKALSRYIANILNESYIVAYYNGKIYHTFKHSKAQDTTVLVKEGTKRINKKAELGLTFGNAFISLDAFANQIKDKQIKIDKRDYKDLSNFIFIQNKENFVIAMS